MGGEAERALRLLRNYRQLAQIRVNLINSMITSVPQPRILASLCSYREYSLHHPPLPQAQLRPLWSACYL
jgi:hypothetical protein